MPTGSDVENVPSSVWELVSEMLGHRQIVCSVRDQAPDYQSGQRDPILESGLNGKNRGRMCEGEWH